MKKSICGVLLALCLLAGLVPAPALAAAAPVWDGSAAESYAGGSGTAEDPYQIADGAQLALLSKHAAKSEATKGKYYVLTRDVDLGGLPWTPIGTHEWAYCVFQGNFDGGFHRVSGLLAEPGPEDAGNNGSVYAGLFGDVDGGTIRNLAVSGTVRCAGCKSVIAGGVAASVSPEVLNAEPGGLISGCCFTGSVTVQAAVSVTAGGVVGCGSSPGVLDCRNDGEVRCESGGSVTAGGVAGAASFTGGCVNTGNVTGISEEPGSGSTSASSNYVGGVVGSNSSTYRPNDMENCLNTGAVTARGGYACAGGLVGRNYIQSGYGHRSTLISCCSTGAVTGGDKARAGGLVGYAWVGSATILQNCYSAGPVTAGDGGEAGGLLGYVNGAASGISLEACYSAGSVTAGADGLTGGIAGDWQVTRSSVSDCSYFRTRDVNPGLEACGKGGSWVEGMDEVQTLTAKAFRDPDSFPGWDWEVWKMAKGLDPEVSPVTARPVLAFPDESAKQVPVMGISLDERALTLTVGETVQLTATVLPEAAGDRTVQWGSSDEETAAVDKAGTVTALAEGTAQIAAAAGDRGAACAVTVVPARIAGLTVTAEKAEASVRSGAGGTAVLAAYHCDDCCLAVKVLPLEAGAETVLTLDLPEDTDFARVFLLDDLGRPLAEDVLEYTPWS